MDEKDPLEHMFFLLTEASKFYSIELMEII